MIGFDFGTTNSGMARVTDGALTAFPIDPYNALNPAVCRTAIYITKRFDIFTGSRAIDRYFADNLGRPVKFQRVRVGEITQTFADVGSFVKDVEIDIDIYDPGRLFVSFKSALAEREYDGTNVNGYRFALQDLIAGQVDMMFDGLGSSAAHIKGGRIRAIAVASTKRAPGFPEVPTSTDGGVPSYQVATWYGIWAPKGTPADAIAAMAAEMRKAMNSPELKATWNGMGAETPDTWNADFGKFTSNEVKRWAAVVKSSGAKLD